MRIFMHKRERFQTCYEKQIRATGSKGEKRAGNMGNKYENLQDMGKEEMCRTVSEAVRNREYQVWYQPQVDMGTGEIFGAEALVRWRHPQKGLLLPGNFIPALEKNGLMPLLDREVLRIVRRDAGEAKKAGIPAGPISVNLSTFCAGTKGLAGEEDLLFEITETAKEEEENREIWRFAKQLREEGFRIAMDDYGMGRSTLKMLCQVPFDILKLDRYFISRIGEEKGETILKSTIALAKDLGMEIVAEGLESREQIAFLLRHGCRLGQGYYYARPLEKDRYFQFRAEGKRLPEGRR